MPTNILLITDGWKHPPLMARFWLSYVLTQPGAGYQFKHVRSLEKIPSMDLKPFHGMVLYFHHPVISELALSCFDDFISSGGGALAIHSVTASFLQQERFSAIIGGRFVAHDPVEEFTITPTSPKSRIFAGIPPFPVKDELYRHEVQPDVHTHFTAMHQGQAIPVVWTRCHGEGRVCYVSPGHRAATLRVFEFQQILTLGLRWVCGHAPGQT